MERWTDPDDRVLARSVFGTDDPSGAFELILAWLASQSLAPGRVTAIALSAAAVATVRLSDLRTIVVKVWPGEIDVGSLAAQMSVQAAMADRGFPAPSVLTRVSALGPGWAVAMDHDRAGVSTDARRPGVRRAMATSLARFVAMAEAHRDIVGLPRRSLPRDGRIWPAPHNALFDFDKTAGGAEWIDDVAGQSLSVMRSAASRAVMGHHDWSAKNMRMGRNEIAVLYDWDSVFLDREVFILGSAAAHFPVTWELDVPETPEMGEVPAFVRDYEQARGFAFTPAEAIEVEAGVTYARAYKARCEHAVDRAGLRWRGSSRESLRAHGPFRLGPA